MRKRISTGTRAYEHLRAVQPPGQRPRTSRVRHPDAPPHAPPGTPVPGLIASGTRVVSSKAQPPAGRVPARSREAAPEHEETP
ncbi:hypothetical protein STRAU_4719 [Streptomyces aurantiacus JA 4570]|uniref:Uncharacterized protein n=1 Tax=Streptomyces aurantiacus JA 4570 TaxID=1286094 RepID=S3ZUX5_9ACTN|nr:hypothetical protein STRAU_4719 [Streptomyces aurantiacus JA 4570]